MASDLILAPESQVTTHLVGRIVPQSGQSLSVVGKLFSEYLAAGNITLSVKGESVQPPGATAPVAWLSTAFQTLTLDVALPGHKFDVCLHSMQCSEYAKPSLDHPIYRSI